MQNIKFQYITDAEGNEKAVIIPIEEWKKIEAQLQEVLQYATLKSGLREVFLELKGGLKGSKKRRGLKIF